LILWIVTPEKPFSYDQFTSRTDTQPNPDPFVKPDPFAASDQPKSNTADPFSNPQQTRNSANDPFSTPGPSKNTSSDPHRHYKGSLIGGLVLITLGSLFLIDQLVPNIYFGDLWPVILVVIGGGLLFNALSGKK